MGSLLDFAPPSTYVHAEIESAPLARNSNKSWFSAKSSNDPISSHLLRFPPRSTAIPPPFFAVDPQGDWKRCTETLPVHCEVLGTVASDGTTGELVRLQHGGDFVKVTHGTVSSVNAIKVNQELQAYRERDSRVPLEMQPVEEQQ